MASLPVRSDDDDTNSAAFARGFADGWQAGMREDRHAQTKPVSPDLSDLEPSSPGARDAVEPTAIAESSPAESLPSESLPIASLVEPDVSLPRVEPVQQTPDPGAQLQFDPESGLFFLRPAQTSGGQAPGDQASGAQTAEDAPDA